LRDSAKHCNFAGDECWYVRTHPKIESVSAASGYTTGGQELTISGWGLKGTSLDNVEVLVDGVACDVTSSTLETITCLTGVAAAVSIDGVSQPGSPGLTKLQMSSGSWPTWEMRDDGTVAPYATTLQTAFENDYNSVNYVGTVNRGWFKAPAAGNYRFYISCDEKCKLYLDQATPFNKASPVEPTLTEIASRHYATEWRHYFITPEVDSSS